MAEEGNKIPKCHPSAFYLNKNSMEILGIPINANVCWRVLNNKIKTKNFILIVCELLLDSGVIYSIIIDTDSDFQRKIYA